MQIPQFVTIELIPKIKKKSILYKKSNKKMFPKVWKKRKPTNEKNQISSVIKVIFSSKKKVFFFFNNLIVTGYNK